ncbi:MAG: acyl carrier protein [Actinomycetia bacterium]|nr:acyl carrier protein [Actinomycetes bacterium]
MTGGQDVLAWLGETIEEVAGVPAEELRPETAIADLGMDSLSMTELAVTAQDKTGAVLSDDDLRGMVTVGDVIRGILEAGREAAGSPVS